MAKKISAKGAKLFLSPSCLAKSIPNEANRFVFTTAAYNLLLQAIEDGFSSKAKEGRKKLFQSHATNQLFIRP